MTTRFPCLNIEGGLFASDLIDQIGDGTVQGQKPADFKLSPRTYLTDEIAAVWTDARSFWTAFQHRLERLPQEDTGTSITRDQWMIPLLSLLGYELTYTSRAAEVDGQTYAISHRAGPDENAPPVHIVGCRQSLDRRPESGRPRLAPHSLLQEYINRTEHLWGIATNGYTMRLLRDSQLIRRQAYIEFDLKQTMESKEFADFALLYRLVHRTRLPRGVEDASECLLERYHSITIEQGGRVRDHLRDGVEEALKILANGILHHPKNQHLRERSKNGELNPYSSYQQLLRLIYRFLFLMVAEERNLITENQAYRDHYSISRLRYLSELRPAYSDHEDLWIGLQTTFRLFQDEELGKMLGVPPLNGDLFNTAQTPDLQGLSITNREFLTAIWDLSMYRENERTPWRRINYSALDVEELGSVYESLLDFQPVFTERDGKPTFELAYGMERKSTGSYYTAPELVNELIKSALVPVLEERLKEAKSPQEKERIILNLKVCDLASGSGHFLLAAARRLGRELAKIRTGDDEPAPEQMRLAIRDVITHCIYGVDKNPLAVDLCKVALWMEGHAKGKPLTFLDHRIRCGDSLIGVLDLKVLEQGIPDEAFDPVTGDDKQVARSLKRQNRSEREGQRSLPFEAKKEITSLLDAYQPLRELPDDTPEQIRRKVEAYQKIQSHGSRWWQDNTACHLWTAAFFAELTQENNKNNRISTTETLRRYLETHAIDGRQIGNAWALAQKHHFFHWPLEFPEVFAQGGFDVGLGNPPWESVEKERNKQSNEDNPKILEKIQKFLSNSGRYPLTGAGRKNLYALFVELANCMVSKQGRIGMVVPTGLVQDKPAANLSEFLFVNARVISIYDFENKGIWFPDVHRQYRFCLCTLGAYSPTTRFVFDVISLNDLTNSNRYYYQSVEDIRSFCFSAFKVPMFRTSRDMAISQCAYKKGPMIGTLSKSPSTFLKSGLVFNFGQTEKRNKIENTFLEVIPNDYVRVYEGEYIHQFDHRFASWDEITVRSTTAEERATPTFLIKTATLLPSNFANKRLIEMIGVLPHWLIVLRRQARTEDAYIGISAIIPPAAVEGSLTIFFLEEQDVLLTACLCANFNSYIFNFLLGLRQAGPNVNKSTYEQVPIVTTKSITQSPNSFNINETLEDWVKPRVLELVYTATDLRSFAKDCDYHGPPFIWDEERRFLLRSELDAAYFHLYGVGRDDVDYIMETFPIVKRKDEQKYGEYRTKRMILECYDAMQRAKETGGPYKTILDPPPADPRVSHPPITNKG